ncbi:monooxygenase [Microthyrium microscopicum]|uniref:Monooxygenase n=1 Tax=Microthyrium microscopicum TaxID=703497 RepID=A0A6A6UPG8_9PEZI|nr:monooxygenase [Microthyrium microscopicum]
MSNHESGKGGAEAVSKDSQAEIERKYTEEKEKRYRQDGNFQYIDLSKTDKFQSFAKDPWQQKVPQRTVNGASFKYLIIGAGYGGLLFAVRLIEAGIPVSDIHIVDSAGGFGGTWYWNRYPGLMCDVESYIYMPLLEEMDYMPTEKYVSGTELQAHADAIATRWGLTDQAIFKYELKDMMWDDKTKEWTLNFKNLAEDAHPNVSVRSQFVMLSTGVLSKPKLPNVPGISDFEGSIFHTSRWDYAATGGSPSNPNMTNLKDKSVGVIGTGATGIQIVPALAKWSKQVTVFQRTPSSVNERGNKTTDPTEWAKLSAQKGWWRARNENFNASVAQVRPSTTPNLIGDAWTTLPTYYALIGSPRTVTRENEAEHVKGLREKDIPHQEKVRARVSSIVKDAKTAEDLKPWYPTWCKRPAFHDEYLDAFNKPNVSLVHTDGKSISKINSKSVTFEGKDYPVDVLIFATGYESPSKYTDPSSRASVTIIGRGGHSMTQKLGEQAGVMLQGIVTRDFPNLFQNGPSQSGSAANFVFVLDSTAQHVSYILTTAQKKYGSTISIEPTAEAEDEWGYRVSQMASHGKAMMGCTPSYMNAEGQMDLLATLPQEVQDTLARRGAWGKGIADYHAVLKDWREDGKLEGLEITACEEGRKVRETHI